MQTPSDGTPHTPQVDAIRDWLKVVGPGPATMFADACQLMSRPGDLGTTSHLVGHLLREILSSLEQVLYAVSAGSEIEVPTTASLTDPTDEGAREKRTSHATKVKAILETLSIDPDSRIGVKWIEIAQTGLAGAAHRRALDAPRPVDESFREEWASALELLSAILERYEAKFLAWRAKLDELLQAAIRNGIRWRPGWAGPTRAGAGSGHARTSGRMHAP